MPHDYRHSPWATGSIVLQYLFMLVSVAALLRFVGLGWIGAAVGGLIVAIAVFAFIYVVLRKRR
jgi:F0F1-type ATP synthase assembly protein I